METISCRILNFISPSIFFISSDVEESHRDFLKYISQKIASSQIVEATSEEFVDKKHKIYAIKSNADYLRVKVISRIENDEDKAEHEDYYCWLVDCAKMTKSNEIFKLPSVVEEIPPAVKQCSLKDICYILEEIDERKGHTVSLKIVKQSHGVVKIAEALLQGDKQFFFEIVEKCNNILFGDLIILENGTKWSLTEDLCQKNLIQIDAKVFKDVMDYCDNYIERNASSLYSKHRGTPVFKKSPLSSNFSSPQSVKIVDTIHEIDIDQDDEVNYMPVMNGRRRLFKSDEENSTDTSSPNDSLVDKSTPRKSKKSVLIEKIEAIRLKKKANEAMVDIEELPPPPTIAPKGKREALEELKKKLAQKKSSSSSEATASACEDSFETECSSSNSALTSSKYTTKSDTASVSSETRKKNLMKTLNFFPAGAERSLNQQKKQTAPKVTVKKGIGYKTERYRRSETPQSASSRSGNVSAANDEADCPISQTHSVHHSADRFLSSTAESEVDPEKNLEDVSQSTDTEERLVTKQDFCRLMSGCQCPKCMHAFGDDDWECELAFPENEKRDTEKRQIDPLLKPPRLLKSADDTEPIKITIESPNFSDMSSIEKKSAARVVVHSNLVSNPVKLFSEVQLHETIYRNMRLMDYKEAKKIQRYACPEIARIHHVFMVNEQNTGKTIAYLPVLISFVMDKRERYGQLSKMGGGPIVVILCSNSRKCEEIDRLIIKITGRHEKRYCLVTYPVFANLSNVDILITTPTVLSELISNRATNFKRICHLVLEDADIVLQSHGELIKGFLNLAQQVLDNRNCLKQVQLITCAQHWTPELEHLLESLYCAPFVCIADHLEAAIYGKMNLSVKFLRSEIKDESLIDVIADKYKFTKCIVICNQEDITGIHDTLTIKGIDFMSFNDTSEEDILYLESVWEKVIPGNYPVMVCTDDIFNIMAITDGNLLVHYSLPNNWSQFKKRFSCVLENIKSPLDKEEAKIGIRSFIFIDETCESRVKRFASFFKESGLVKHLPSRMKQYFDEILIKEENNKIAHKTELCKFIKRFGKCHVQTCSSRHVVDEHLDQSVILPKNGSIRFKILLMTDAGTCSIQLLEHYNLNGEQVETFEDMTIQIQEILKKNVVYHAIKTVDIGQIYLHQDQDNVFNRCRVIVIEDPKDLLFYIDRGIYVRCSWRNLYEMPDELKEILPQCFETSLANLIPPYDDKFFCRNATKRAQFLIDSKCSNKVMNGNIVLQLGDNLWIDNVYEIRETNDPTIPNIGFQLCRQLVKENLAIRDTKPLSRLYDLCKSAGISLPEYTISKPKVMKVEQIKPSWAFMDEDDIHEVTFTYAVSPSEFYVRQNKFSKQLKELEQYIQKTCHYALYPPAGNIEVNNYYLVKDKATGDYCRAIVLSIYDEEAEVMCVDYGDVVFEQLSKLKHITNEMIERLPFQGIQCSLFGIGPVGSDWEDSVTDVLYKMVYVDGTNQFKPLFTKIISKQSNQIIPRQYSYSLMLKEGFNNRLLNALMLDCGFAILKDAEKLQDFELPKMTQEEYDEDIEEISRSDLEEQSADGGFYDEILEKGPGDIDPDAFDIEIIELVEFLNQMNIPTRKLDVNEEKPIDNSLPAIKAAPPVDFLTPEVHWSQTDKHVKLNINICDVVTCKMVVTLNRTFKFNTEVNHRRYHLNLLLFAKVLSTCQYSIAGSQVRVILEKQEPAEWPRLLNTTERMRNIKFDVISLKYDDDEKRQILKLDISDDESSSDDEDYKYFVCSDLDSDYDYDIPEDTY